MNKKIEISSHSKVADSRMTGGRKRIDATGGADAIRLINNSVRPNSSERQCQSDVYRLTVAFQDDAKPESTLDDRLVIYKSMVSQFWDKLFDRMSNVDGAANIKFIGVNVQTLINQTDINILFGNFVVVVHPCASYVFGLFMNNLKKTYMHQGQWNAAIYLDYKKIDDPLLAGPTNVAEDGCYFDFSEWEAPWPEVGSCAYPFRTAFGHLCNDVSYNIAEMPADNAARLIVSVHSGAMPSSIQTIISSKVTYGSQFSGSESR